MGGDSVTGVTLSSAGAAAAAAVNGGKPYTLNVSAAVGSGLSNYTIGYVAGSLTVTPAPLSLQNAVYGSTTTASTIDGALWVVLNGDSVVFAPASTNFVSASASANANSGVPIAYSAGGVGNDTLTQPVGLLANITPVTGESAKTNGDNQASPAAVTGGSAFGALSGGTATSSGMNANSVSADVGAGAGLITSDTQSDVSTAKSQVTPQPSTGDAKPPSAGLTTSDAPSDASIAKSQVTPQPPAAGVKPPSAGPGRMTDCAGGVAQSVDPSAPAGGDSSSAPSFGCQNVSSKATSRSAGIINFALPKLHTGRLSVIVGKQFAEMSKAAFPTAAVIKLAAGISLAVSVGLLAWLLRGSALLTVLLSSMPLWRQFDPLAIVLRPRRRDNEDDEVSSHVDRLFGDATG